MKNAGIKISAEITREDGSVAQTLLFDQRGLTYLQLLEIQQKVVVPVVQGLMLISDNWMKQALEKAKNDQAASPTS